MLAFVAAVEKASELVVVSVAVVAVVVAFAVVEVALMVVVELVGAEAVVVVVSVVVAVDSVVAAVATAVVVVAWWLRRKQAVQHWMTLPLLMFLLWSNSRFPIRWKKGKRVKWELVALVQSRTVVSVLHLSGSQELLMLF